MGKSNVKVFRYLLMLYKIFYILFFSYYQKLLPEELIKIGKEYNSKIIELKFSM